VKRILIISLLIISTIKLVGQNIGAMEIEDSAVRPWIPKFEIEYAGIYHFGESESESTLRIFYSGTLIIGQIQSGYWEKETGIWKGKYENLSNILIKKDGKFICDQYSGQFVIYSNHNSNSKGLRIDKPWNTWLPKGEYEVGIRLKRNPYEGYAGKFPQASSRQLQEAELDSLSKTNMKIMKNEIFARYGFEFRTGGEMDKYFSSQEWYRAQHKSVNEFLTELELKNIELIKKVESSR
jgi:hypothetical protein